MEEKLLVVAIVFVMLFSFGATTVESVSVDSEEDIVEGKDLQENTLESIHIIGDDELDEFADEMGLEGDGSEENPYELKDHTIGGDGTSIYLENTTQHFHIKESEIIESDKGVEINTVSNFTLESNILRDVNTGILVRDSDRNEFNNNLFTDHDRLAIEIIGESKENTIQGNELFDTSISLRRSDNPASQEITSDNTLNDDPILYLRNSYDEEFSGEYGQVIIANSLEIGLDSLILEGGSIGIEVLDSEEIFFQDLVLNNHSIRGFFSARSTDIVIEDSLFSRNEIGIFFEEAYNSSISGNVLEYNFRGLSLRDSFENDIYKNSINDNEIQAQDDGNNTWDGGDPAEGGSGGNFWSDYDGQDRGDGIGEDTYNKIENGDNQDRFPLTSSIGPPVNVNARPFSADHVNISWEEPYYSIRYPIENITLYRGTDPDNLSAYQSMNATSREFTDENVTEGEEYHYGLKASNSRYESSMSEIKTAVPDSIPPTIEDYGPQGENVPINATIVVEFSEEMREESVNISVDGVRGDIESEGNTFRFIPEENLSFTERYYVNVTGTDLAANPLEGGRFSWNFMTVSTATIIGRVVDDDDGEPIEDATIDVDGEPISFTDQEGGFEIEVPPGNLTLEISKEGYETEKIDLEVGSGEVKDIGEIRMKRDEGIISRTFWPMALVGAIVLLLGVLAALVTLKNWEEPPPPDEEDIYEEDYEDITHEEFESWWDEERS